MAVPVNSKTAHPTPRQLTRIKLRTVGNLTQNEARGSFDFRVKMSVSSQKQKDFAIL